MRRKKTPVCLHSTKKKHSWPVVFHPEAVNSHARRSPANHCRRLATSTATHSISIVEVTDFILMYACTASKSCHRNSIRVRAAIASGTWETKQEVSKVVSHVQYTPVWNLQHKREGSRWCCTKAHVRAHWPGVMIQSSHKNKYPICLANTGRMPSSMACKHTSTTLSGPV